MKRENPFLGPAPKRKAGGPVAAAPAARQQPQPSYPPAAVVWESWRRNLPQEVVSTLRRGAADEELRQLDRMCGVTVPQYARDIWAVQNGQAPKDKKLGVFGCECRMLPVQNWLPLLDTVMEDAGLLEQPEKRGEVWEWWGKRGLKEGLPWQWGSGRQQEQGGRAAFPGTKLVPAQHPHAAWVEKPGDFVGAVPGAPEDMTFIAVRPGLTGGSTHVSFRLQSKPDHYLYAAGSSITLERYGFKLGDKSAFQKAATFVWHRSGSECGGAFEHVSQRGKFITYDREGNLCLAPSRPWPRARPRRPRPASPAPTSPGWLPRSPTAGSSLAARAPQTPRTPTTTTGRRATAGGCGT
eukprot:TRINITY_DN13830_c0_g1_i1.p1 TRINITY_DN13830_c0_g1~~TRINITY_DN13830_c0_g1_i1.p1  ORF type:complete len:352 (+),score=61.55 TRINITY_DN13830_c0_g1_i1:58-1113(+)